jgi:glutathione S-transferase
MEALPRLLTIPLSHYCEKARWALDRSRIAYREEPHIPLLHRLHTARIGCRSVPVLVTGSEILPDSHSIVRWATTHGSDRLYPVEAALCGKVLEVERYVDRELGPHVRRWAYSYLLGEPGLLAPCFARNVTRLERLLAPMVVQAARPLIRRAYRVDEATGRASLARAEEALAEVARWLADGRTYLVGDSFTAADLAFASLAAPLVCAPQYGGAMPPYDSLPAPMRSDIERLRASRSGAFVLELYARERAKSQRGHTPNRKASR